MQNKMMTLAAVLCCACTFVFTACEKDNPSPAGDGGEITGSWCGEVTGKTFALWNYGPAWQHTTFNEDGTGKTVIYYTMDSRLVAHEDDEFTYTTGNGTLTMTMKERNRVITTGYTVKENRLLLSNETMQLAFSKPTPDMEAKITEWDKDGGIVSVDPPAKHTVFVYGNAGGTMDQIIEDGLWTCAKSFLTDSTNVRVVCMYKYGKDGDDGYGGSTFTGKYAAPGDVVWFELDSSTDLEKIHENGLQAVGMGEVAKALKICDPSCLRMFMEFSSLFCPAEKYTFVVWGHGSGFNPKEDFPGKYTTPASAPRRAPQGVIADEWNEGEALDMYEFRDAILSTGRDRLYTIFFHNCLMGNLETLTEIKDYADYICASEHILYSNGLLLSAYIYALGEMGNTEDAFKSTLDEIEAPWSQGYQQQYPPMNGDFKLLRTDKFDAITDGVKRMADWLVASYATQKDAIDKATLQVYCPLPFDEDEHPLYDAADYAHQLAKETNDTDMKAISDDLDHAFSEAIIQHIDINWSQQHLDHYTLSLCLVHKDMYTYDTQSQSADPSAVRNFNIGYEQSTFHKKTGWGTWLGMNDQWLYANPKCGGEDTPQQD